MQLQKKKKISELIKEDGKNGIFKRQYKYL